MTDSRPKLSGEFQGERLRLAIEFAGIKINELAETLSVSRQYINVLENGREHPSPALVQAFGEILGFDPIFFYEPIYSKLPDRVFHFRAQKTVLNRDRQQAKAYGKLFSLLSEYLETNLTLQPVNIPRANVKTMNDIESIADRCRKEWGLGENAPIKSMSRVIESCAGGFVTQFNSSTHKIDAFSIDAARGVVIRSSLKRSSSRARMDFGHELGHLVLHSGRETGDEETEKQAFRFAGAFLVPESAFKRYFPKTRRWNWQVMLNLKRVWGMSLTGMVYRARDLLLIDEQQAKNGFIFIRRTWGDEEPCEPPEEEPVFLNIALDALEKGYGMTPRDVARNLGVTPSTFEKITGIDLGPGNSVSFPLPQVRI